MWLEQEGTLKRVETKTNAAGAFTFTTLAPGRYLLSAEKSGQKSHDTIVLASPEGDRKNIDLILDASADIRSDPKTPPPSPSQAMKFSDEPNFSIAGVTDWTAAGGHGSDSACARARTSRVNSQLKPDGLNHPGPSLPGDAGKEEESESKLRTALAGAPTSFDGNHQLGEFYFHAGRYRESIPLLQAAYQIDPTMDDNTYDLARAHKEVGDYSRALEYVRKLQTHKDSRGPASPGGENLMRSWAAIRWLRSRNSEPAVRLDRANRIILLGIGVIAAPGCVAGCRGFQKGSQAIPKIT